ncbi:Similar to Thap1: THAP domain-containing protein 1 (Mus musculus) [Cotesia congregata]|uniref:Similar to Thap1: THAP domain-containing protein 1 (Mus musculus) n=1 Tax=Cotesia congregata TaxID=51543 RepID=A0A8J2MN82_COTCN|nr:Similar to Thap1: THAP domain-containing protein 1 (Mus musculus) [Cotesia congregata]
MGFRCIVTSCRARYKKESPLSFYQLPKDEKMKEQWFSILTLNNLKFSSVSRICSRHFTDESFIPRHFGRGRSLRSDAIPTLFIGDNVNNDNKVIKTTKKFTSPNIISVRRQPNIVPVGKQTSDCNKNEIHSDNTSPIIESDELLENDSRHADALNANTVIISEMNLKNCDNLPRRRRYFEGDFSIEDMDSPENARFYFQQARNRISELQKQIQIMKKKNKQLNDNNLKLLMIIQKLNPNDENLIDEKSELDNPNFIALVTVKCDPLENDNDKTEIFRYEAYIPDEDKSTVSINDNEQENMNKIFRYVATNSIDADKSPYNVEQEAENVIYRYIFSESDHDYCT